MNQENHSEDTSVAQSLVGAEPLPLLTTKLYRPPVTPDLEQRTRLMERLSQNRHRPLTLISAPAGYGKTSLASMWLETCGCSSVWLSLDEADSELDTFVRYLLAAVRSAFPTLELKTEPLLDAPTVASVPVLARYLLNDLAQTEDRFILALDDVHLIQNQAIFDLLGELLHHPLPSLHLVLIGRHDPDLPISSLRAHSQVTEIRAQDLRFTARETTRLLRQVLQREIDEAVAAKWTRRTEGWVTALRLAALSLRHRGATEDLGAGIEGNSRYVQEYLLAEVLSYLPAAKQACLLKAAILDRFCAPLVEAVCSTGEEQAADKVNGEAFLDWLQRENLFLVPLDDRHEWFRLHHIFQQHLLTMLQEQMRGGEIGTLRLRASRWHAENGLVEEALQYALAAGDVDAAVHLVKQYRYDLMNTEQWSRLERWMKLLPEDAVAQNPVLMSTLAYVSTYRGEDLVMLTSMQQAEHLLAKLPPEAPEVPVVRGEVAVIQGVLDIVVGHVTRAVTIVQESLELLPPQALHIRGMATAILAVGLQMQGDLRQGVAVCREALADRAWPAGMQARMLFYLSIAYVQEGNLTGVLGSSRECLRIAEPLRRVESVSFARYFLGVAHYLRDEFAQAEPYLLALLEDRAVSAPNYLANGVFALALVCLAHDRLVEAEQVIDLVGAHFEETGDSFALAYTEAFRVELALRKGDLAEAHRLSQGVEFNVRPPIWFFYVPQLTSIKLLLAEGSGSSLDEARRRLEALDEQMHKIRRHNVRIDVLALLALIHNARGDEAAAMEKLSAALSLGKRGGFIRTFVDLGRPMADLLTRLWEVHADSRETGYIDRILTAFPDEITATTRQEFQQTKMPPPNPLTRRERQVIILLATDLSPEEIADKLVISPHTLNTHIKNIYHKLDVHKREGAVRQARELGLIR